MDASIFLLAMAAVAFTVSYAIRRRPIAATEADWFVVFDINAEAKVLALSFYPIVGFKCKDNKTYAIVSCQNYAKEIAASRPAKKVNDTIWGVSVSYGKWLRDGAPFDEGGSPDYQDGTDFSGTVEKYLLGDFKLHYCTAVPFFYQGQIGSAIGRINKD